MLSNQNFVSNSLIDEMYQQSHFDFQRMYTQIRQWVENSEFFFAAIEKRLQQRHTEVSVQTIY